MTGAARLLRLRGRLSGGLAEDHGHESGHEQEEGEAPPVQATCTAEGAPNFGNSDIFGASIADPTAP